jgi:hypothetical protein
VPVEASALGIADLPLAPFVALDGDMAVTSDAGSDTDSALPLLQTNVFVADADGTLRPAANFVAEQVLVGRRGIFFQGMRENIVHWGCVVQDRFVDPAQCANLDTTLYESDMPLMSEMSMSSEPTPTLGSRAMLVQAWFPLDGDQPHSRVVCPIQVESDDGTAYQIHAAACPEGTWSVCLINPEQDESVCPGEVDEVALPHTFHLGGGDHDAVGETLAGDIVFAGGTIFRADTGEFAKIQSQQDLWIDAVSGNFVVTGNDRPFVLDTRTGARTFDYEHRVSVGPDHYLAEVPGATSAVDYLLVSFDANGMPVTAPVPVSVAPDVPTVDWSAARAEADSAVFAAAGFCGPLDRFLICRVTPDGAVAAWSAPLPRSTSGVSEYYLSGDFVVSRINQDLIQSLPLGVTDATPATIEDGSSGFSVVKFQVSAGKVFLIGEDAFGKGMALAHDLGTGTSTEIAADVALEEIFGVAR